MSKTPLPGSQRLNEAFPGSDEETKVTCPACKGSGTQIGQGSDGSVGSYRQIQCMLCKGVGMIAATKASDWRRKLDNSLK